MGEWDMVGQMTLGVLGCLEEPNWTVTNFSRTSRRLNGDALKRSSAWSESVIIFCITNGTQLTYGLTTTRPIV